MSLARSVLLEPIRSIKAVVRSALFVTQVLPLPVKPQEWMSREPARESVTFALSDGEGTADIYRIADGRRRAGVLVFLGINPAPRDDHRVVNLGRALARSGFVAMFAWSPSLIGARISPREPDNLVRAFQHLRGLEYVDQDRVGMGGFCVGASLLMIAASDSRIHEQVNFVSSFGAYYDMRDMIMQISAQCSFYGLDAEQWVPNHLTQEVLRHMLIEGLPQEEERDLLTRTFVDGNAPGAATLEGLSMAGNIVYELLRSTGANEDGRSATVEGADRLMRELPQDMIEEMAKISPSTNIGNLKARVLIAHDREDDLVPSEESRRLADALSERGNFHYTEFSFFSHVTPNKRVAPLTFVKESFKLFRYAYSIIRVAD